MLKYKYNKEKKEKFLKFWGLKSLREYPKKAADTNYFLYVYLQLTADDYSVIDSIIRNNIKSRNITVDENGYNINGEEISMPAGKLRCPQYRLEDLDDYNLINYQKNRSALGDREDRVTLTPEFAGFIGRVPFISKFTANGHATEIKSRDLNRKEKKQADDIYARYLYDSILPHDIYESLVSKNVIYPGLTDKNAPALYTAWHTEKRRPAGMDEESMQKKELPSFFIYTLDQKLYELYTGSKVNFNKNIPESRLPDQEFILELAKSLKEKGLLRRYLKKNLYSRYRLILKNLYPEAFRFYGILADLKEETPWLSSSDLSRFYYRWHHVRGRIAEFSPEELDSHLEVLRRLALVSGDNELFVDNALVRTISIARKSGRPCQGEDRLIIDSDINLNIYRDRISPSVLYILLLTGDITFSEFVCTFQFNLKKMPLAAFCHLNPESLSAFLKANSPSYHNENVEAHVRLLFNHVNFFTTEKVYMISTSSNELYMKAVYLLEKSDLRYETNDKKKNTILVHSRREYDRIRRYFRDNRLYII